MWCAALDVRVESTESQYNAESEVVGCPTGEFIEAAWLLTEGATGIAVVTAVARDMPWVN